jgi:hypothetical protein
MHLSKENGFPASCKSLTGGQQILAFDTVMKIRTYELKLLVADSVTRVPKSACCFSLLQNVLPASCYCTEAEMRTEANDRFPISTRKYLVSKFFSCIFEQGGGCAFHYS